jgi:hypothetical protein
MSKFWKITPILLFITLLLMLSVLLNTDSISIGDYAVAFTINIWSLIIWSMLQ